MDVQVGSNEARLTGNCRLVKFVAISFEDEAVMRKAILVVEDSWQDRALLSLMLESAGYCVIHALNGAEALCVFRRHRSKVAIVIMGDRRTDPEGEFAGHVQRVDPELPVISKSAQPWDPTRENLSTGKLRPLALMIQINRAFAKPSAAAPV